MHLPFSDTQSPICFSCWGVVKHSFIHSFKPLENCTLLKINLRFLTKPVTLTCVDAYFSERAKTGTDVCAGQLRAAGGGCQGDDGEQTAQGHAEAAERLGTGHGVQGQAGSSADRIPGTSQNETHRSVEHLYI